jgi:hypothetical protein
MERPDPGVIVLALYSLGLRSLLRVSAREPVLRQIEPTQAIWQTGCPSRQPKTFETLVTEAFGV